jgi:hypothetical protein
MNYFIGWRVKIYGILTPNLKFPFNVHHNKYKDKKEKAMVGKNEKPVSSSVNKKLFKNPSYFTITKIILGKIV